MSQEFIYTQLFNVFYALVTALIAMFMWTSRREISNNDVHKKEMEKQAEKFILLKIDVVDEKFKTTEVSIDSLSKKYDESIKELKILINTSRLNERELYQRDETKERISSENLSEVKQRIAKIDAKLSQDHPKN